MRNFKLILMGLLTLFVQSSAFAAETTEDFESITLTDVDSWGYGKGLSNGWKIVGGTIYTSEGTTNYGIWDKGNNDSSKSLEASYSSTNSAIVVIPTQLTGTFKFYARKTSSSSSTKGYIDLYDVEEDGSTYKKSSSSSFKYFTLTSTTWTEYTVDLGDEPRLIAICLSRAAIDDVVFNTYEQAAGPRLSVLKDNKAVKNGSNYGFGLVAESTSVEYVVKNAGTETMNATIACTGNYASSDASVSLAAGEEKPITITLSADAIGSQTGSMTISPEGLDAFTINFNGIVRDPSKLYLDFSEAPEGWTVDTQNWTIADGYAKIGYFSSYSGGTGRIESPLVQIADDETIYLRYSKNTSSTYSSAYFKVLTSEDGKTWTQLGENLGTDAVYGEWSETTISGIPTSAHYVAIAGQYIAIDDFYGLSLSSSPILAVEGPGEKDGNVITDNYGYCKGNTTHTYTLSNAGAGTLEVNITSSNAAFSISESNLTLNAGESKTLDVTFVCDDNYGKEEATITILPTTEGVDAVTINATAIEQDPETFEEDFENGIPKLWTNKGFEVVSNPSYGNGTKMAYAGRYSSDNTLTTPLLVANAGDVIELQALLPWDDETLTMEYSMDKGETWEVAFAETPAANNTLCTLTWTAPADGTYLLRFKGRYNYFDNIRGFKYAPEELEETEYAIVNKWATLCYPADVTIAEGVQAFKAVGVVDHIIELSEIEGTIPAYEPVLLYSADKASLTLPATSFKNFEFVPIHGSEDNLLVGCTLPLVLNSNNQYVLQMQNNLMAFYRVNPSKPITTKAFRSYLEVPNATESKLMIGTIDEDATSISSMTTAESGDIYDLNGRKVENMQKGIIYIIGNHKVIIK